MSSPIGKFVNELWTGVSEEGWNMINEAYDKGYNEARDQGIAITAAALYEAKINEKVIIDLLQKHWDIRQSEAKEFLRFEKTVIYPRRELEDYLSQDLAPWDVEDFMTKNDVRKKLKHDPTLHKLTPAELKRKVEENE